MLEMSYDELWKALDDSLKDIRKLGETIPLQTMNDLHSARTYIDILKVEPSNFEIIPNIENYLESVEAYIVYATQDKLGPTYVEKLMEKVKKIREKLRERKTIVVDPSSLRFVPGLPRGKPWIRIHISKQIPKNEIMKIAEKNELSFRMQRNNYILVYGSKEKIENFVKKIAETLENK